MTNPRIRPLKYSLTTGWNTVSTRGPINKVNSYVGDQGGAITLWVSNDEKQPMQYHDVYVALTGEEVPPPRDPSKEMWYLGTCVQTGGMFVTHAYIQL